MRKSAKGFSLVEMLMVMAIFMIISSAVFALLSSTQRRYRDEQQLVEALQGARVALDQIVRDIHHSGYPPKNSYDPRFTAPSEDPGTEYVNDSRVAMRMPGMVGAILTDVCTVDTVVPYLASTCDIPGPYELLIETDLDPENPEEPEQVEWVFYRVETPANPKTGTPTGGGEIRTLYRMVSDKALGANPRASGITKYRNKVASLTPMVENVVNDPAEPAPVAGDHAVFRYVCAGGAASCRPSQIQEIHIVLRVQTRFRTMTPTSSGQPDFRSVELRGVARPLNPVQ